LTDKSGFTFSLPRCIFEDDVREAEAFLDQALPAWGTVKDLDDMELQPALL
jgi:hypothetical protein